MHAGPHRPDRHGRRSRVRDRSRADFVLGKHRFTFSGRRSSRSSWPPSARPGSWPERGGCSEQATCPSPCSTASRSRSACPCPSDVKVARTMSGSTGREQRLAHGRRRADEVDAVGAAKRRAREPLGDLDLEAGVLAPDVDVAERRQVALDADVPPLPVPPARHGRLPLLLRRSDRRTGVPRVARRRCQTQRRDRRGDDGGGDPDAYESSIALLLRHPWSRTNARRQGPRAGTLRRASVLVRTTPRPVHLWLFDARPPCFYRLVA